MAAMTYGMILNKKKSVTLVEAIKHIRNVDVSVVAKVEKVCEKKGCWMSLVDTSNKKKVRVTFKDYGFFVPLSLVGKKVKVQGMIKKYKMSRKEADHYAEDAGLKKYQGNLVEYRMIATGVELI